MYVCMYVCMYVRKNKEKRCYKKIKDRKMH